MYVSNSTTNIAGGLSSFVYLIHIQMYAALNFDMSFMLWKEQEQFKNTIVPK